MIRAYSILAAITLWACGGEYEVRVQVVPPELLDDASLIEIAIVPSCGQPTSGPILGDPIVRFAPGETPPALGSSETGARGLFARIVDDQCQIIAVGCAPVNLSSGGSDILRVIVRETSAPACVAGELCNAGRCQSGDGGPADAGAADTSAADTSPGDASVRDVGVDVPLDVGPDVMMLRDAGTDVGPPVVDTTCWAGDDNCDWSTSSFSLVESSLDGLEAIPRGNNWAFTPNGCSVLFSASGDLFVTTRSGFSAPFGAPTELESLNTDASEEKAVYAPGELEVLFTRLTDGDTFVYRARRGSMIDSFGPAIAIDPLNRAGFDSYDISLSGNGRRLYMARPRNDLTSQDILVAQRSSLSEEFGEPVLVDEVSGTTSGEAEPSPTADDRTLVLATTRGDDPNLRLYYTTRNTPANPWGALMTLPGAFFDEADEREGAISPDGCELLVSKPDGLHRLVYTP